MQFFKFLWKVESFYLVTEWHAICNHREIFFTSWTFCQDVNSLNKNSVQFISHHLNKPNLESLLKQYYLTTVTLCVHVWWMNGVIQCDKNKYIYTSTNWFIFFFFGYKNVSFWIFDQNFDWQYIHSLWRYCMSYYLWELIGGRYPTFI